MCKNRPYLEAGFYGVFNSSKHWHLIDYVIVRRTDRQDVKVTKTMCGARVWCRLLDRS